MRYFLLLSTTLLASACTQPAAHVEQRGHMFFGQSGGQFASAPAYESTYHNTAKETAVNRSYRTAEPARQNYDNSTNSASSISSVSSSELAPLSANKSGSISNLNQRNMSAPPAERNLWSDANTPARKALNASTSRSEFIAPVDTKTSAGFGESKSGKVSDGIRFAAASGEPVYASASGEVAFASDELKSYGNMVIIKHSGNMNTSYTYLSRMVVSKNTKVTQGQIIGYMSNQDMQFTLRNGTTPINPTQYLSKQMAAN